MLAKSSTASTFVAAKRPLMPQYKKLLNTLVLNAINLLFFLFFNEAVCAICSTGHKSQHSALTFDIAPITDETPLSAAAPNEGTSSTRARERAPPHQKQLFISKLRLTTSTDKILEYIKRKIYSLSPLFRFKLTKDREFLSKSLISTNFSQSVILRSGLKAY